MIAVITSIIGEWFPYNRRYCEDVELKSISAIVVAVITTIATTAGEWFP